MEQPENEVLPKLHVPRTAVDVPAESFASPAVFTVDGVSIYYGSFRAVTNVSLTIHENESPQGLARPRERNGTPTL